MADSDSPQTPAKPQRREWPGWAALALIAIFVLTGVVMYLVGVRLIKR